jgi:hypothetical protein
MINHAWRKLRFDILKLKPKVGLIESFFARTITLIAVIIGWVYFRADTINGANNIIYSMVGGNGISLPTSLESVFGNSFANSGITFDGMFNGTQAKLFEGGKWIISLFLLALYFPNCQQIIQYKHQLINIKSNVQISIIGITTGVFLYYIFTKLSSDAEFLYFNF